jgi:hypothetical protein
MLESPDSLIQVVRFRSAAWLDIILLFKIALIVALGAFGFVTAEDSDSQLACIL